ncbi:serine/threonine-protein kinase PknG [Tamaricihabitans halophyticus]|uniref:non-specific serine/threonine protein kinase n=1 Tax=Tamaricihabitans halophyticus TaxID=1262583 RepID=A0A4R2PZ72_9PSEU|nr:serine/threonine-protein kinase PknG [Tamaricihabitans halophyticus]
MVSEEKRYCGNCGSKVGRSSNGTPGEPEGTCAKCGTLFSFRPRLSPGDLVGGQYEVLGALAYGGLGWIHLAKDHNVSDRWVVLKGLIDAGDETAMAAAVAEQRFLAEVEHPNIVRIYNFVQHPDPRTGHQIGYIVMEYVGGQSLRQLALAHHRETKRAEPMPIGQVIAYGLEILPALGYLHAEGMLYCDLKPDNVIQTHEQLKLIDLGAVRRMDDYSSPLFFTTGYSAPELATSGASIASDIYTIGRTLAVLSFEFTGYTSTYKHDLPTPDQVPLFTLFGSFYRVLRKATHKEPERRFASCEDMADQLHGVLREIMALGTGKPRPGNSTEFSPEMRTFGSQLFSTDEQARPALPELSELVNGLPVPQVDTDDVAAGLVASSYSASPRELVDMLAVAPPNSVEVRLRLVRARLQLGEMREAAIQLGAAQRLAAESGRPYDWRLHWYQGLIHLAAGRSKDARASFDAVYSELPGEISPKLALGVSAEQEGDYFGAARFYELVWRTDRSYVSAAFGLARVYLAQGARTGAVEVLESVPDSSSHYVDAQVAAIKIKTRPNGRVPKDGGPDAQALRHQELFDAARKLEALSLDAERRALLTAEVLEAAHGWVLAGMPGAEPNTAGERVLGWELSERELRFGLERCYRALARLADTRLQRIALVDRANEIRPRTLT